MTEGRSYLNGQRMQLVNRKTSFENKRNKLEDSLLDEDIDADTYKRLHAKIQDKIYNINDRIEELENKANIDTNLIEEVLFLTRNIHETYKQSPAFLKRHYLRFFFEKLYVKNCKISRIEPTPIFSILRDNQEVIITDVQLEKWYEFGKIDWVSELEYPEWTVKEVGRFLQY